MLVLRRTNCPTVQDNLIICIPKGDKDRQFLKNWRAISLLCVTYKLASTIISNRLRPYLDNIISKTQSGFLTGRNIADSTRFVYNIMQHVEEKRGPFYTRFYHTLDLTVSK